MADSSPTFEVSVRTSASLDEAVPGARADVTDHGEAVTIDQILERVRTHLESAQPGNGVELKAVRND